MPLSSDCFSALDALYTATAGATSWSSKTNWDFSTDPCTSESAGSPWSGLSCDSAGTLIDRLDLSTKGLSGTLPTQIGKLCFAAPGSPSDFSPVFHVQTAPQLTGTVPTQILSLIHI